MGAAGSDGRDNPCREPGLEARLTSRGADVVDGDGVTVGSLNATALAIWELCDGETSPGEMVEAVCAVSGIAREAAEQDVHGTLRSLAQARLVRWEVGT